jgi:hypothetical protein
MWRSYKGILGIIGLFIGQTLRRTGPYSLSAQIAKPKRQMHCFKVLARIRGSSSPAACAGLAAS